MSSDATKLQALMQERRVDSAATIWDRIRKGKQAHLDVQWPGREDVLVRVVVLTSSEEQAATAAAYRRFAELELPLNAFTADEYSSEEVTQRLALALRDPETDDLAFETADQLRDCSTSDERYVLWSSYLALKADQAPNIGEMTLDEFNRIRDAVKKKDAALLSSFGHVTLVTYLLTTGSEQLTSQMDSSTPGE